MHDYTRFTKKVALNVPINTVYELWATQSGLEKWFLRSAPFTGSDKVLKSRTENAAVGDTYEWMWHGWGDSAVERGTILEANGKDLFKFSFGKAGKRQSCGFLPYVYYSLRTWGACWEEIGR